MGRRIRRGLAVAVLGALLTSCATFPDDGPRAWQPKIEGVGELGGPPSVPEPSAPSSPPSGGGSAGASGEPKAASGCADADPQVIATCLNPIGAIAVLPDAETALVGERTTGRVLQVAKGHSPVLVATIPVDVTGGGGLTGLLLSPSFVEDQLVYAYVTTPTDNRVVRIARGEPAKPVLVGIPRGPVDNGGALAVDVDGSLLVATGDAGGDPNVPGSLAGKVLRIDTLGRPGKGNPTAGSPVLSSGLHAPGGICVDTQSTLTWVTDRDGTRDVLHKLVPGPLPAPAWTWPDRPGVAGCMAAPGVVTVAESTGAALFVLHPGDDGTFTGDPEKLLVNTYGRLSAAAPAPDGLLWLGTVNKAGGKPVPSDDRVIRIQPPRVAGQRGLTGSSTVNDRRRLSLLVTLLGSAFIIAAGVLNLIGEGVASLVCIVLGLVVGLVGIGLRPRRPVAPPTAAPVDTARIREEREANGEDAAVRTLRTERPELSLLDATRIVRGL